MLNTVTTKSIPYKARLYEENEIHHCNTCQLTLCVTFAAVPVEPLQCCGQDMELLDAEANDQNLDLSDAPAPPGAGDHLYRAGEFYTCIICGIEVKILRQAQPIGELDCCGEGMEVLIKN